MRHLTHLTLVCIAIASMPVQALAQQQDVVGTLSSLLLSQSATNPVLPKDEAAATAALGTVSQLVQVGMSNMPLSSSAGGFVSPEDELDALEVIDLRGSAPAASQPVIALDYGLGR